MENRIKIEYKFKLYFFIMYFLTYSYETWLSFIIIIFGI